MTKINGFIVVRLPPWNEVAPGKVLPPVREVYYEGVDRWEWADIFDDDYYAGTAPEQIRVLANRIEENGQDLSSIRLTQTYNDALALLSYSNRIELRNELIVIESEALAPIKGEIEIQRDITWLGYDVFAEGEWSLISGGIFAVPRNNEKWLSTLNRHGLFEDESTFDEFVQHYQTEAERGALEELAPRDAGFRTISVRVGRLVEIST